MPKEVREILSLLIYHIVHVSGCLWSIFGPTELLHADYMNLAIKTFRLGDLATSQFRKLESRVVAQTYIRESAHLSDFVNRWPGLLASERLSLCDLHSVCGWITLAGENYRGQPAVDSCMMFVQNYFTDHRCKNGKYEVSRSRRIRFTN